MSEQAQVVDHEHVGEEKEPIHLFVQNPQQADATMPLRWCICPRILDLLKGKQVENPYILISVIRVKLDGSGEEVVRKVVPLEQEMDFIVFRTPGEHWVHATIVWSPKKGDYWRHQLLKFSGGGFCHAVFYDCNKPAKAIFINHVLWAWETMYNLGEQGSVSVNVPEQFFAKEPPAWLKRWVNFFEETPPRDECQFRRRMIFAFTIQPFALLGWAVGQVIVRLAIVLGLLSVGMRKICFSPLIHPFGEKISAIWEEMVEGSIFLSNAEGRPRFGFFSAFMPAIWLSVVGTMALTTWPNVLQWIWFSICSFLVVAISFGFIGLHKRRTAESRRKRRQDKYDRNFRQAQEKIRRRLEEQLGSMVCKGIPCEAVLSALPKKKRTIYLRFMNLKAKVCRPFRRG